MKQSSILFLKGICIGVANIIPGVSGGTVAVLLQIYYPVIQSISDLSTLNFSRMRSSFGILLPIILGAVIGLLASAQLLLHMIEIYTTEISYGFAGLVVGSIPSVFHALFHRSGEANEKTTPSLLSRVVQGILCGVGVIACILPPLLSPEPSLSTFSQTQPQLALFIAAVIGSATMILPGISGSLVLVLLGLYPLFVGVLGNITLITALIICAGLGIGIFGIARLLNSIHNRYEQEINAVIFGLVCASPAALLLTTWDGLSLVLSAIFIVAAALSLALGFFAKRMSKKPKKQNPIS